MPTMVRAYIGLGSNLADPPGQISQALVALQELPGSHLVAQSACYRSVPLAGGPVQPDYVNAVVALDTCMGAHELLLCLQRIEKRQGRVRKGTQWGARTLDLDILLFGDLQLDEPALTIPHPGLSQRDFVIYPLQEIAPGLSIPGLGNLQDCIGICPLRGLQRLEIQGEPQAS